MKSADAQRDNIEQLNEHNCPTETIRSWRDLMAVTSRYMDTGIRYAYRGEADQSWDLVPSLLRLAPDATADRLLRLERDAYEEFATQAHLHISDEHLPRAHEPKIVSWWPLMQHHGAPTRLLDWTHSPFVAAYFAVEKLADRDGVVYVIDAPSVQEALNDSFEQVVAGLSEAPGLIPSLFQNDASLDVFFWSQTVRRSLRSVAQQGLMSLARNIGTPHSKLFTIANFIAYHPDEPPAARWVFPSGVKNSILKNLRVPNIAAHSLFPGLDGLGRSVTEAVRIGPKVTFFDTMTAIGERRKEKDTSDT